MEPKKYEEKKVDRWIPVHFLIGLNAALLITLAAFEWKSEDSDILIRDYQIEEADWDLQVPLTPPPPPVKPKVVVAPTIVETQKEPEEPQVEIVIDQPDNSDPIPDVIDLPLLPVDNADEVFHPFEAQPDYPGGMASFYALISKHIKYPASAKRMGMEGKVFIGFIIEKDGSLSNIEVLKGVHKACDDEALRVMKLVPKFIPGEQRGEPVRVRMTIPIHFQLAK